MPDRTEETARKWWKDHYKNYREVNIFTAKDEARKAEWDAIYKSFNITSNKFPKIVDFGCGTGRITLRFLKKGFNVYGIDISDEVLSILKKRARLYKLSKNLHTIKDGLYSPLKDFESGFDAGYMIVTFHCISNDRKKQEKVFKNFMKLIRSGGKVLILEPNPLNPLFYLFYLAIYRGNLSEGFNIVNSNKGRLRDLLRDSGAEHIKVNHYSFLPPFLINRWYFIKNVNKILCSIPGIRNFSAYHIIVATKK